MVLIVLIGSWASVAVSRVRLSKGSVLTKAAFLTYAIPSRNLSGWTHRRRVLKRSPTNAST